MAAVTPGVERAAIFSQAMGERMQAARGWLVGLPALFPGAFKECRVAISPVRRLMVVVVLFDATHGGPEVEARFDFWASQAGAQCLLPQRLLPSERGRFASLLLQCRFQALLQPANLADGLEQLLASAGMGVERRQQLRVPGELAIDLRRGGGAAVTEDVSEGGVFVSSEVLPPLGDRLTVALRLPSAETPFEVDAQVVHVRSRAQAAARKQRAGFGLKFLRPSAALSQALADYVQEKGRDVGAVPRPRVPPVPVSRPLLRLRYESLAELERDYRANLSHGGAFLPLDARLAQGDLVTVEMELPGGRRLQAPGSVVHIQADGMGLQLSLDATMKAALSATLAASP